MTYKILVVDDEPDLEPLMLQRMRRQIRSGRFEFVFAGNGVEALEKLAADSTIDMVLSDINMPQMDGLTLLEQIPDVNPNLRAVIISAYGDMQNIRTAMNRGAFDFVTKPVDFDDLQVTVDRTLAHIEEWRAALDSRDKLVALQNELDVASKMQQSILPTSFPKTSDYETFGTMHPALDVGGDFYDVVRLPDQHIGLAIADVSGKGVPAALFMMSSRTLLKGTAISFDDPGQVLSEVNSLLQEDDTDGMFVTMLYAVYNAATGEFTYASGGHDAPLLVQPDGSSTLLPLTGGIALGVLPGHDYKQTSHVLQPGETIVLYTDGVTEAMNADGELFGIEGLREYFANKPPVDSEGTSQQVMQAVADFAGDAPQSDDITCLTLQRN
ncbi:MAG: SpoIIE family protein phosphatase [Chloroflexi bacterium]|nr:SpoIIE family protein phosphatase [Chloroflexota bacterium]